MTQKRGRKPRPKAELPEGGILENRGPIDMDNGHGGDREIIVEMTAADLGLDKTTSELAERVTRENFDDVLASEVKAFDRRGLGFTPAFDIGKSLRDRLGSKVLCFETAPEGRPGSAWAVCPKREFTFDPKTSERDYRYEVEIIADNDAQLAAAIDVLLATANQPVLFAGLQIWLHAAGRHGQAAVKVAAGQVKKVVELIFRASEP